MMRAVFGLETKTPTLAIDCELGIPLLDLYVKQTQDMLALRAHNLDQHTRMSNTWLSTPDLAAIISNSQGNEDIKARTRQT